MALCSCDNCGSGSGRLTEDMWSGEGCCPYAANTDLSAPTSVDRDAVMGGVLNHLPKDTWLGGACVTSGFI